MHPKVIPNPKYVLAEISLCFTVKVGEGRDMLEVVDDKKPPRRTARITSRFLDARHLDAAEWPDCTNIKPESGRERERGNGNTKPE